MPMTRANATTRAVSTGLEESRMSGAKSDAARREEGDETDEKDEDGSPK